jgi:hypothetical protein
MFGRSKWKIYWVFDKGKQHPSRPHYTGVLSKMEGGIKSPLTTRRSFYGGTKKGAGTKRWRVNPCMRAQSIHEYTGRWILLPSVPSDEQQFDAYEAGYLVLRLWFWTKTKYSIDTLLLLFWKNTERMPCFNHQSAKILRHDVLMTICNQRLICSSMC